MERKFYFCPRMNTIKTLLAAIFAMMFWALSFVWVKVAYETLNPMTVVTSRALGAGLFLLIIGWIFKRLQPVKRGDVKYFLMLAFFEPFLYFMGESFGMQRVSSTLGAVIVSTIPLFAPIAGFIFSKERIKFSLVLGIVVSLLGVFFIVYDFDGGFNASISGVLLMFVAVFAAIAYSVVLRKLTHQYTGYTIVAYQNIIGFVFFLPFFFWLDWKGLNVQNISMDSVKAVIQLTIFASVVAFLLFTYTIKHIGVTRANAFVNLIPAITYIFAILILDEALVFKKVLGIVIVIGGLFVSQVKFGKKQRQIADDGHLKEAIH